jgi:hypothetical protein
MGGAPRDFAGDFAGESAMKLRQLAFTLLSVVAVFTVIGASLWNSRTPALTDGASQSAWTRFKFNQRKLWLLVAATAPLPDNDHSHDRFDC